MGQIPPPSVSTALGPGDGGAPPLAPVARPRDAHRPDSPLATAGALARGYARLVAKNRKFMVGTIIVGFFVLVAIFGPFFVARDPNHVSLDLVAAPSAAHPLGTNQLGQDVFSQLVVGTRASVFWSFVTGLLVMLIAVTVGLVGGYFGGAVDDALTLITNVFLVIPSFPMAIVAVEYFNRSTLTVALVVAFTNWPWGARVIRAQTLSIRNREFVAAARANGESNWRLIFFDIFPNQLSIVAASFVLTTIQVLLQVAGLEFLGFGDSRNVTWGVMENAAYTGSALLQGAWWWFVPPGLCIALLGSGLALLNFGIDEIADPRLRLARRRPGFASRQAALAQLVDLLGPKRRRARRGKVVGA